MKKILYFLLLLAYNSVVMAQSTLITPGKNQQESPSGDNITIKSSSGFLGIQSLRYNGTSTSKTAVMANDELLNIGGSGFFTSSSSNFDNALIQMTATQNWNSTSQGTKINFFTTANGTNSKSHRMIIDQNGEVGIGVINPEGNLHVHQPQSVVGKFKLTNNNTGISATDGLDLSVFTSDDLLHPLGAGILNKENNSLYVMKPVYMEKSKGCLECHTSGGNNESQVVAKAEDEVFRGMFMVISSVEPVREDIRASIFQITLFGLIIVILKMKKGNAKYMAILFLKNLFSHPCCKMKTKNISIPPSNISQPPMSGIE